MNDAARFAHGADNVLNVAAIARDKFELGMIAEFRDGLVAVDKTVEKVDRVAALQELGNDDGADVSGAANDEDRVIRQRHRGRSGHGRLRGFAVEKPILHPTHADCGADREQREDDRSGTRKLSATGEKANKNHQKRGDGCSERGAAEFIAERVAAKLCVKAGKSVDERENKRERKEGMEVIVRELTFGELRLGDVGTGEGEGNDSGYLYAEKIYCGANQAFKPARHWQRHCAPMVKQGLSW